MAMSIKSAIKVIAEQARLEFDSPSDEDWRDKTIVVEILPGPREWKFSFRSQKKEKGK